MTVAVEEVLAMAGYGKDAAAKVKNHEVVHFNVDTLTTRELAAGFAMLVKRTPEDLDEVFLMSDKKEESDDSIQYMERMVDGTLDFSKVELMPAKSVKDSVKQYANAATSHGSDDLNLSQEERAMFAGLDKKNATKEQVEEILKKVLAKRLQDYQQKGLEGVGAYQRKSNKSFEPGAELREKTEKLAMAKKVAPEFMKYSLDYPNNKPTTGEVKEAYGWINFNIDDKPTFSIFHKVSYHDAEKGFYLMFHRHFYVSRGHNSVQAVGACFPVENEESLVMLASRTSTDLVAGFGGSAKKALGSRIMGGKLKANFEKYRTLSEKK
ncbi:expressed unknown protein [Seminavis robusta]|uniref:Uncharacterized protein n=1 Tax=Seminavis robusta TaxID=568900 RepID=A0A9N8E326_9STRA|nr:expressed unknown protein [Seminavis robusta]|eukprot:Sro506_g156320.1 n/a (323) ;mRNA; r:28433-29401